MRSPQCIFCPNKADSKEHIWSDWILQLLPDAKDGIFTTRLPSGEVVTRKISKPDQRAKLVCARACNNGWMSKRLEVPMKALTADIILKNTKKVFTAEECATIAAWAFKATVLANHIHLCREPGEPFFPTSQRYSFAQNLTIPDGVYVWIARRNAGHLTATYRSVQRLQQPAGPLAPHLIKPERSPYRFQTYTCVFSIGFLLLQVLAARWTEWEVANRLNFPTIVQAQVFEDYATALWPNNGFSVSWPPPLPIGNDLFERFWDRFNTFGLPGWMAPYG